jgi:hypothetical protein
MKFVVERTSGKPVEVEGVVKEKLTFKKCVQPFNSYVEEVDTVDMDSIDELLEFIKNAKQSCIIHNSGTCLFPTIEIYDDYRE